MEKPNFNILVYGHSDVGKASIITNYVEGKIPGYIQTIMDYYAKKKELSLNGNEIVLNFEKINNILELTIEKIKGANAFVYVYDITNQDSCNNFQKVKDKVYNNLDFVCDYPFFVVGNKNDDDSKNLHINEVIYESIENNYIQHFFVSAKNSINIDKMFNKLVNQINTHMKKKEELLTNKNEINEACCKIY